MRISRWTLPPRVAQQLRNCLLLGLSSPLPAAAVAEFIPYGSVQTEYHSNIFALESRQQALVQNGEPRLADQVSRYIVGAEGFVSLSKQNLRAKAESRRLQFAYFDELDHDEYLVSGGLDWHLSRAFKGLLEASQERRIASFEDRRSTTLTLETERIARATANVDITPRWRLETTLQRRELDSPLPDFPEFELQENTVGAALKYLVVDHLAAGIIVEHVQGQFEGTSNAGGFRQTSVALTGDYSIEGFSELRAEIGATQRQQRDTDGEKALTGRLAYKRALTSKTKIDVQVFRRLLSYVGGASSIKEDGASANVIWQSTPKTAAVLLYQRTQGRFEEASSNPSTSGRSDKGEIASLTIKYQVLPWMALRPYAGYQSRRSSTGFDSFESSFAGIELLVRLQ